jgi:hypothetical protein
VKQAGVMIVISVLSVLAALYVAEAWLQLSPPAGRKIEYTADHDRRSKRDVVFDLRRQGDGGAVPMVYPSFLVHFPDSYPPELRDTFSHRLLPLGGLSNRTTVLCNEGGQWAVYRADEHGFRNPPGSWRAPPRVAIVGDSFSHGNCVSDGEDWAGALRKSMPGVLNLGMGGNGPLFMLATIREYLRPLKPRVVIWQYLESHETRIPGELKVPLLQRYLGDAGFSQNLGARQPEIDAMLEKLVEGAIREPDRAAPSRSLDWRKLARLRTLRDALRHRGAPAASRPAQPNLADLARILQEAKRTVESWGGRFVFLYLPTHLGLQAGPPPAHYASREQVLALAASLKLEVIDVDAAMRASPDPLAFFPYRADYHYNAAGYSLVADTVLKRLSAAPAQATR